eukprot:TRINITY_DN1113_c1_g1_i3.p2 TRINITY_DN1113_c1_g1~~TRINITY_DN1113_c1_g1_i3.p2  ORF type:complete len:219 (+),score=16.20 TRINITY_DN1113_c1_g1_i3:96-659(+)
MRSETGRNFPSPMPSPSLVGPTGFAPTPAQAAEPADLFPGVNPQAGMTPHPAMFYTFPPLHSFHPMYQSPMMQFGMPRLPGGGGWRRTPLHYPADAQRTDVDDQWPSRCPTRRRQRARPPGRMDDANGRLCGGALGGLRRTAACTVGWRGRGWHQRCARGGQADGLGWRPSVGVTVLLLFRMGVLVE